MVKFTNRESQCVKLIDKGLMNKTIGEELGITEQTVKNHVSNAMIKLGAKNRTELAVKYIESNGL
jgi:DNA-binding NarL/FixJ family response regulator